MQHINPAKILQRLQCNAVPHHQGICPEGQSGQSVSTAAAWSSTLWPLPWAYRTASQDTYQSDNET